MAQPRTDTNKAPKGKSPKTKSLGLGLAALAMGALLAGLASKGCATPTRSSRTGLSCPEPDRSLAFKDRHGRTVALVAPGGQSISLAPAYTQHCRRSLGEATCAQGKLALDQGLQQRARELVGRGLRAADKHIQSDGAPISGVLVAIRAADRDVLVLVGLRVQDGRLEILDALPRRELGTTLKPLLAAAAIASGAWTPDTPLQPPLEGEVAWKPKNFSAQATGPISLRDAIQKSTCCGMVRLAAGLDPKQTRKFLRDLGLVHGFPSGSAPGLGAQDADLLAVTNAYATLAAHGWSAAPRISLAQAPQTRRVMTLDQVTDVHRMLRLDERKPGVTIGLPGLAGKRGTTPEGRDGWFIGYSSGLAVGVWFGLPPDGQVIKEPLLAKLAERVWLRFLADSLSAG